MKATNHFTRTILTYLELRAESDTLFAESFAKENKNIDDCCLWIAIHKHHCVGSYYTKEDSLILSASIDGKRIETIEISISQLKVIQSRGVCNQNTEHHNSIINLVNQNLQLIEERLVA